MTDQLTRIGRGVPQPPRPRPKPSHWVIAAAVLISIGLMVSAVVFFGPPPAAPTPTAAALPVERQLECASVKHEHDSWKAERHRLDRIPALGPFEARYESEALGTSGKAYLKVVSGYSDEVSKELAVAIAQYDYDIGLVTLELTLGDKFDPAKYATAVKSWEAVEQTFARFNTHSCEG